MRRIAEHLLHDPELAADAVQETFAKLWHKRWRLSLMKNPQGFAITTLKNQCVSIARHQKHLAPLEDSPPMEDDVNETLAKEQQLQQLEEAILTLPPLHQQIIRLRYVEQLSTREVAERLQMSETNVNTTMSRAKEKLRVLLTDADNQNKKPSTPNPQ